MELIAPLSFNHNLSANTILLFAFISGIFFGFFLEKAGFGNAKKLVEQFYFTYV